MPNIVAVKKSNQKHSWFRSRDCSGDFTLFFVSLKKKNTNAATQMPTVPNTKPTRKRRRKKKHKTSLLVSDVPKFSQFLLLLFQNVTSLEKPLPKMASVVSRIQVNKKMSGKSISLVAKTTTKMISTTKPRP